MSTTIQETAVQFKEVVSTTVFIAETKADYANSMALLQQNGLRPMTYQEAFVLIDKNLVLKKELKGTAFYLDGIGLKESGYYTFDNDGKLSKGKGIERAVCILNGKAPLSLLVNSDDGARFVGARFFLIADYTPKGVAPVVVGVKINQELAKTLRQ